MHGEPFLHAGETFALAAALVWSGAVILFKKASDTVHPIALNLFKNTFALVLFVPTVWLMGTFHPSALHGRDLLALALSGVLGIAVSDTFFFKSLQLLGAGLFAIIECLYVVFIVSLSYVFLGERLAPWQLLGAALISGAVGLAVYQKDRTHHERRQVLAGLFWGAVSMLAIAVSVVLMKDALNRVAALDAMLVRLAAGTVALLPFSLGRRGAQMLATLRGPQWPSMVAGSFLGMFGATLLWVLGMKYALASIASSLNQLSTVFVFVLAMLFLHEQLTVRKAVSVLVATGGALLVILGG